MTGEPMSAETLASVRERLMRNEAGRLLLAEFDRRTAAVAAAAARAVQMEELVREMAAYACDRVATGYEPVQSRGCGKCLACRARALRALAPRPATPEGDNG